MRASSSLELVRDADPGGAGFQLRRPDGFASILHNVRSLSPFLRARSDEMEAQRRLLPEVVQALRAAGAFRMLVPRSWGGPELSTMEQLEIIEELSAADASVGWCVMIGSDSGFYSGFIDDAVARRLWPDLDMVQAGWAQPAGRAEIVEGGYIVSGQWRFCSGSTHADNIAAGCLLYRNGEPELHQGRRQFRIVIGRRSDWRFDDVWYTTGLRATASNDYTTSEPALYVPLEHTLSLTEPKRDGALWARPDTFLRKMAGIPLGVARRIIDEVVGLMSEKCEWPSGTPYRRLERVRSAIGEARTLLAAARSYVFSSVEKQWHKIERNEPLTAEERADVWLARLNAFQSCRTIVRNLYDIVGGGAVFTRQSSLDRALRDLETMCQHFVGQRRELAVAGGLLLGNAQDDHHMFLPR